MCNSLNKSLLLAGEFYHLPFHYFLRELLLSAGGENCVNPAFAYTVALYSKNIRIYIHIFQIYREYFFVNTKQDIVRHYKGLSSQETSMISMLPEKLD